MDRFLYSDDWGFPAVLATRPWVFPDVFIAFSIDVLVWSSCRCKAFHWWHGASCLCIQAFSPSFLFIQWIVNFLVTPHNYVYSCIWKIPSDTSSILLVGAEKPFLCLKTIKHELFHIIFLKGAYLKLFQNLHGPHVAIFGVDRQGGKDFKHLLFKRHITAAQRWNRAGIQSEYKRPAQSYNNNTVAQLDTHLFFCRLLCTDACNKWFLMSTVLCIFVQVDI